MSSFVLQLPIMTRRTETQLYYGSYDCIHVAGDIRSSICRNAILLDFSEESVPRIHCMGGRVFAIIFTASTYALKDQ